MQNIKFTIKERDLAKLRVLADKQKISIEELVAKVVAGAINQGKEQE